YFEVEETIFLQLIFRYQQFVIHIIIYSILIFLKEVYYYYPCEFGEKLSQKNLVMQNLCFIHKLIRIIHNKVSVAIGLYDDINSNVDFGIRKKTRCYEIFFVWIVQG